MGNGAGGPSSLHLWGRNNTSHRSGHREAMTEAIIRPSTCPCVSVMLSVPVMLNLSSFVRSEELAVGFRVRSSWKLCVR